MNYLTYCGNQIVSVKLPADADVFYAPPPIQGLTKADIPQVVRRAFCDLQGGGSLESLVRPGSRVLIAFDDNCQPFPQTSRPDIRQQAIETLISMLTGYGVDESNIELICAVALHRKMKRHELARMLGARIMRRFYPNRLINFDAEDRDRIADLGTTDRGEPVQVYKGVIECDLVIYVDTVQIPLNGGHKSVAVGLGSYESIANHHHPKMTADCPHVMQPDGSKMHECIERISRVVGQNARIVVMEAVMNNAIYPAHLRYLAKAPADCNAPESVMRAATTRFMKILPEPVRKVILAGVRSAYAPMEINAGDIDAVHTRTISRLTEQVAVPVPRQYSTLVFGLPDLSPYSVGARINPVLVVSDVLGYVFNWFYGKPLIAPGGVVIILNPAFEVFHPEYHVAYERFYREVLPVTTDPFEMQEQFQESFARDPKLVTCYRERFAHHGFHPFTVWYWATYALKYLSNVILVGPPDDRVARTLGVDWAPDLDRALAKARETAPDPSVCALTIPPFFYTRVG